MILSIIIFTYYNPPGLRIIVQPGPMTFDRTRIAYQQFDSTGGPWIPGPESLVQNIFSGTLLIANYPTAIIISMNVELNGRQQIATWKEKQFDSSYQLFYLYFISWFWLEKRFGGHPMFERNCLFISSQVHPGLTPFDPLRSKFDRIKCVCLQSGKNAIDLFNTFRSNQLPISFEITQ